MKNTRNTLLTSGHDSKGSRNNGSQESEGASNEDVAPRQQNEEAIGLTEPSQSIQKAAPSNSSDLNILGSICFLVYLGPLGWPGHHERLANC